MHSIRLVVAARALLSLVIVLAVVAPATAANKRGYDKLYTAAEAHVSAGRLEQALVAFADAAKTDPTKKEPWVRAAQLQFDAGRYGRAIVAAEEVLQRDPQDRVADSVLTIAGMRIATLSLQRLQASGALAVSETARKEAEQLAGAMRTTLGAGALAAGRDKPEPRPAVRPPRRRASARATATPPRREAAEAATQKPAAKPAGTTAPAKGGAANPFDVLGD